MLWLKSFYFKLIWNYLGLRCSLLNKWLWHQWFFWVQHYDLVIFFMDLIFIVVLIIPICWHSLTLISSMIKGNESIVYLRRIFISRYKIRVNHWKHFWKSFSNLYLIDNIYILLELFCQMDLYKGVCSKECNLPFYH